MPISKERGAVVTVPKKLKKRDDVLAQTKRLLSANAYVFTGHARMRLDKRELTALEALYVLRNGHRKPARDRFNETDQNGFKVNRWSYVFEGKTLDERHLRIAISFKETNNLSELLLIITVIDLDKG